VHHITYEEAAARAQVKASIWTPALPWNAELGMMPFLIVSAVRAPTVIAPSISKIVPNIIACLYVIDLEESLVAHAFATSSIKSISICPRSQRSVPSLLTCTVVVRIEHGKKGADDKM